MKITDFQTLWRAVNRINIDTIARIEVEQFEREGLDTDLSDIYSDTQGELYTILKNGTIRKVIVHICDVSNYQEQWELPKFHIMECVTLENMRENHRMHRYKKASRFDGKFWIIKGNNKRYERLHLCRGDCLKRYNKIYNDNATIDTFDIKEYMEKPIQHLESYVKYGSDMTSIPRTYAKDWQKISNERKEYHRWTCQECFFDCSNLKKYLHTHHIDTDMKNNKYENLKVLCIECHAEQFQHGHIKKTPEYKKFLNLKNDYAN